MSAISRISERSVALGRSGGFSRKSTTSLAAFVMRPSGPACAFPSLLHVVGEPPFGAPPGLHRGVRLRLAPLRHVDPARFIGELGGWIGRYNTERCSDALGARTPAEFRATMGRAA